MKNKVFCIGEPKTGTSTLGICLRVLGIKSCGGWRPDLSLLWNGDGLDFDLLLEESKKQNAYHDFPWNYMQLYQKFDKVYPNSKFILTVRDSDKWFDSFKRWGTRPNGEEDILWRLSKPRSRGPLADLEKREKIIENFIPITKLQYGIDEIGPISKYESNFISAYENRNNEIIEYFADRPNDFLVINWEEGDGWDKLCNFLGYPIPDEPLPHMNKSKK